LVPPFWSRTQKFASYCYALCDDHARGVQMSYEVVKFIHLIGMVLLLGAGGGSAYYKYMTDRYGSLDSIVLMNKHVVLADWLFTTPAVIIQPISGMILASILQIPLSQSWLKLSILLYLFSVGLWLVAVYLQIKMKKLALEAQKSGNKLSVQYTTYAKIWFMIGFPSFLSMMAIVVLMVFKY
jgi:uncharacterized membrane protein